MQNSYPGQPIGPYVNHGDTHFPLLTKPYDEPDRGSYIDDETLCSLRQVMADATNRTITGNGFTPADLHNSGTYISDEALAILADKMVLWRRATQVIPAMSDAEIQTLDTGPDKPSW